MELGIYRHYKGYHYQVIGICIHTETLEEMVVYRALYGDGKMWARPKNMFEETIDVDGNNIKRFTLVDSEELALC